MRVFVSHKNEDTEVAAAVGARIRQNDADVYIDVLDTDSSRHGDEIGEHVRRRLGECSHLMAVVSERTKDSWWVPWEIGIATEKDYPLASFAGGRCTLPTYLKKWPYLLTLQDVDTYVSVAKAAERATSATRQYKVASEARSIYAREFYSRLRTALGQ